MKYSNEDIKEYVELNDIKFIRLAFCDIFGKQKNIAITASILDQALEEGVIIDTSAICGFKPENCQNLVLHPDTSTLAVLPWRPEHGGVVRMFCSVSYLDGTPFECDTRTILENAVKDAAEQGISFTFGSDMEFYLFLRDENGEATKIPYDNAHFMDIAPEDKGENVRREVELALERMGITPESSHHEEGPGQNEIDFKNADPLKAADDTITFHSVVKTIAARNGLAADFSPRPLVNQPGNGMHINITADMPGKQIILPAIMSGILNRAAEMTAFFNTVEESYSRLGSNSAPKYVNWGTTNKSQLMKLSSGKHGMTVEFRSADALCNPYLVFALLIRAGLEGLNPDLVLPVQDDGEYEGERKLLPETLAAAKALAAESEFIKSVLPKEIIDLYTK